jgi:hypothetical protein
MKKTKKLSVLSIYNRASVMVPLVIVILFTILFLYTKLELLFAIPEVTKSCSLGGFLPCSQTSTPGGLLFNNGILLLIFFSGVSPLGLLFFTINKFTTAPISILNNEIGLLIFLLFAYISYGLAIDLSIVGIKHLVVKFKKGKVNSGV